MNVLKLAVISCIILFLLVTGISLFIPSQIRISRAVNMQASADRVYMAVADLTQWRNWHPVLKALPNDAFVIQAADSMQIRNDHLKIIQKKKEEVIVQLQKENGRPVISGFRIITHPQSDSLTVQGYMDFHLPVYPWEKFRSLFYENIYGLQMEQGLQELKNYAQSAVRQ